MIREIAASFKGAKLFRIQNFHSSTVRLHFAPDPQFFRPDLVLTITLDFCVWWLVDQNDNVVVESNDDNLEERLQILQGDEFQRLRWVIGTDPPPGSVNPVVNLRFKSGLRLYVEGHDTARDEFDQIDDTSSWLMTFRAGDRIVKLFNNGAISCFWYKNGEFSKERTPEV